MTLIELPNANSGKPIWVNPETVAYIKESSRQGETVMFFAGQANERINLPPKEVVKRLQEV